MHEETEYKTLLFPSKSFSSHKYFSWIFIINIITLKTWIFFEVLIIDTRSEGRKNFLIFDYQQGVIETTTHKGGFS